MTIEELKEHCIRTIKISGAIENIPNVKITDSRSLQEHKMVLKLIEAWEKVEKEINESILICREDAQNNDWCDGELAGFLQSKDIIDRNLSEVSE